MLPITDRLYRPTLNHERRKAIFFYLCKLANFKDICLHLNGTLQKFNYTLECTPMICNTLHRTTTASHIGWEYCYSSKQFSALHCNAVHCTALHRTALHWTALHFTLLSFAALYCTALHFIVLHCTALKCTDLNIPKNLKEGSHSNLYLLGQLKCCKYDCTFEIM